MRYTRKLYLTSQGYYCLAIPKELAVDLVGPEGGDVWIYSRPGAMGIIKAEEEAQNE